LIALPVAAVVQAVGSTYFSRHEAVESPMTAEPIRRHRWFRRGWEPPDDPQEWSEAADPADPGASPGPGP
jgi:hypothetical protein